MPLVQCNVQYNFMHFNINTMMFQVFPGDVPRTMLKTQCVNQKKIKKEEKNERKGGRRICGGKNSEGKSKSAGFWISDIASEKSECVSGGCFCLI